MSNKDVKTQHKMMKPIITTRHLCRQPKQGIATPPVNTRMV